MNKGFTLIEIVVSVALVGLILIPLSLVTGSSYREYIKSNKYKDESDIDLENIQQPYTTDSKKLTKSVEYTMETNVNGKPQKTTLSMYSTTNKDSSISLSRFEATDSNFKESKQFVYKIVDPTTGELSMATGLENYSISNYDDLPTTNYSALNQLNKTWGNWSFVGWSLTKLTGKNTGNVMSYRDKTGVLYCGNPDYATVASGYQGIITESNYQEIMDAIDNGTINMDEYTLVPAYFFSQDREGQTDTKLLAKADNTVRRDVDNRNLNNLAKGAAQYIKEKGLDAVNSDLNTSAQNAIYGNGLEILHFRENGWPQVARNTLLNGNGSANSSYENSDYYQNQTKIDNGSTWKTGFIYETFNTIGYDITQTDDPNDWLGVHYKYNILLFGNQIEDNTNRYYSLFMQINKSSKTVRIFIGRVESNGSLVSLRGYYDVTASYA